MHMIDDWTCVGHLNKIRSQRRQYLSTQTAELKNKPTFRIKVSAALISDECMCAGAPIYLHMVFLFLTHLRISDADLLVYTKLDIIPDRCIQISLVPRHFSALVSVDMSQVTLFDLLLSQIITIM